MRLNSSSPLMLKLTGRLQIFYDEDYSIIRLSKISGATSQMMVIVS